MSVLARLAGGKRGWIGAAVLVVAAGLWVAAAATDRGRAEWIEVERDDLVLGVDVTGTLQAIDTSLVGPPQLPEYWEFKIAFMAPEGDEVAPGTRVLAFDTSDLQQQLQRQMAEASEAGKQIEKTEKTLLMTRKRDDLRLAEAQSRLRKARLTVERPGELSSAQELALARLDLELAEREVAYLNERMEASGRSADAQLAALSNQQDRAKRRVEEIQRGIEEMNRKATRGGTVVYVKNWREEKKKVGDTCWKGENIIELPDLSRMEADGRVDEADAGKLAEGQRVSLRLDAHPDVEFKGSIASIWKTVQRKNWRNPEKVARLTIELDETDRKKMRPSMRFRGTVETERIRDALIVPIEAVFISDTGPVIYRKTLLGHEARQVTLGRRNETSVEVLAGLGQGDSISVVDLAADEDTAS